MKLILAITFAYVAYTVALYASPEIKTMSLAMIFLFIAGSNNKGAIA